MQELYHIVIAGIYQEGAQDLLNQYKDLTEQIKCPIFSLSAIKSIYPYNVHFVKQCELWFPQLLSGYLAFSPLANVRYKQLQPCLTTQKFEFRRSLMQIRPPFMVSYSITTKCNLKCKHCYSDSVDQASPDELSTEEAFRLVDDLSEWGVGLLIIDGGEPLCRDDLLDILRYASSKGIRTTIGSNATLIDEAMARKLLNAGVMSVAISVDGVDAHTHDSFRGLSGAFQQTLTGIEACREAGLPFQFNMVIRKDTLSQLEDMLHLAVDSGANAAEFFDLVASGRAKRECKDQVLSLDERKRAMEWLAEAQEDCPIVIRVPGCPMYPLLLQQKQIQPKHFPKDMLRRVPYYDRGCAAGMPMGYVMVLSNGEVNPCMLLQVRLGNVREQSIISIWENSPVLAELRQRESLKGECRDCSYKVACSGCRGRAYEETGDMMAADPGCWLASKC